MNHTVPVAAVDRALSSLAPTQCSPYSPSTRLRTHPTQSESTLRRSTIMRRLLVKVGLDVVCSAIWLELYDGPGPRGSRSAPSTTMFFSHGPLSCNESGGVWDICCCLSAARPLPPRHWPHPTEGSPSHIVHTGGHLEAVWITPATCGHLAAVWITQWIAITVVL